MDPRLLDYYNQELQHVREVGGEFARQFPKIAGRLGLSSFECADPYVERLLEGFAFLAARVQLKVDAEFPEFTQQLLETVYPHYLAPTPSMAIVKLNPDLTEGSLAEGFKIEKGTPLRSLIAKSEQTACEYRTAHDLTLWPLEIIRAEYLSGTSAVTQLGIANKHGLKAGIRIRLRTSAGLDFNQIETDSLPIYLCGEGIAYKLYEQIIGNAIGVAIRLPGRSKSLLQNLPASSITTVGYDNDAALLPFDNRSFQGYRLLQEYFNLPQRFLFVQVNDLREVFNQCEDNELDIVILLDRVDNQIRDGLSAENFALFCTPAINLFPKRADRIHLSDSTEQHHIVPDRARPMDYEVFSVSEVSGYGTSAKREKEFLPFYGARDFLEPTSEHGYYCLHRNQRVLSSDKRRRGKRSSYIGSEVFISLVDSQAAPYSPDLKQLALETLCTNRDLPLHMPLNIGTTDFTIQSGAPVESVKCIAGPTAPKASSAKKDSAWKLISHLSLNYLSLVDNDAQSGAAALREMLTLYCPSKDESLLKQIDGINSINAEHVVRRLPGVGPISFGRGVEISVNCDEAMFEGYGVFLLGCVLEQFFARYSSINSFAETVMTTIDRGEIMRWPVRTGTRQIL